MEIYIPSCDRADTLSWGVARFASPAMQHRMLYVVPEDQVDKYTKSMSKQTIQSGVIGCPEKGISKTRHWIGQRAAEKGVDKFLMVDDDCWFYTRKGVDSFHLDYSKPPQIDDMLAAVEMALDRYAHVGISAREGNNRQGNGGQSLIAENTRTLRALAYRTEDFLSVEHGRVPVMEDFDVNLQLLERGLPNCNLIYWAQGQRQTNAPGGCSTYRSHAVQEEAAKRLAELHPGVVSLRQKKNKSGGEFGHRTEVTIQWKKAYSQGVSGWSNTSKRVA